MLLVAPDELRLAARAVLQHRQLKARAPSNVTVAGDLVDEEDPDVVVRLKVA